MRGFQRAHVRKPQEIEEGFRAQESRALANFHKIPVPNENSDVHETVGDMI